MVEFQMETGFGKFRRNFDPVNLSRKAGIYFSQECSVLIFLASIFPKGLFY